MLLGCSSARGWEKKFQRETYVSEGRDTVPGKRKAMRAWRALLRAMEGDADLIKAR